jgi:hypothetical protein
MLATYMNALIGTGLGIDRVVEPAPTAEWMNAEGPVDPVPVFIVVRSRKGGHVEKTKPHGAG